MLTVASYSYLSRLRADTEIKKMILGRGMVALNLHSKF